MQSVAERMGPAAWSRCPDTSRVSWLRRTAGVALALALAACDLGTGTCQVRNVYVGLTEDGTEVQEGLDVVDQLESDGWTCELRGLDPDRNANHYACELC